MPAPLYIRFFCRTSQFILYWAAMLIPWPRPQLIQGKDCSKTLPEFVRGKKLSRPMIVTDPGIIKLGLANGIIAGLKDAGLTVSVFGDVVPNPTVTCVEEAVAQYNADKCDHLIAIGGGSAMDTAKVVGARHVRPRTPIRWMKGIFKVLWPLPPLICVPTTAGTGSECTLAAVVTNPATREKYPLEDPFLIPRYAFLDPVLTVGLPKFITSTTGIDTLTHAVEAYCNIYHTKRTDMDALRTVELVFKYLKRAFDNGNDLEAREGMQEAAYLGGAAFTRMYVGNIHAAAHTFGGFYNVPHGYANAVIMPHCLDMYGSVVYKPLARLAEAASINGATDEEKAKKFIQAIKDLNASMDIPTTMNGGNMKWDFKKEDIPAMVSAALSEANPIYPVPVIFNTDEMTKLITAVV